VVGSGIGLLLGDRGPSLLDMDDGPTLCWWRESLGGHIAAEGANRERRRYLSHVALDIEVPIKGRLADVVGRRSNWRETRLRKRK
jgi:hypothetical protein